MLDNTNEDTDDTQAVTEDIPELLETLDIQTKFEFNLPSLHEQVPGVGPGNLVIVFARPESGKTAFWVNLVGGLQGFASQGAKVCALINEEPAVRTQMRVINAHTGMTRDEIIDNMDLAKEKWQSEKTNEKSKTPSENVLWAFWAVFGVILCSLGGLLGRLGASEARKNENPTTTSASLMVTASMARLM